MSISKARKGGIRHCKICEKEMKVYGECIGKRHNFKVTLSDQGVFFELSPSKTGVWFCNECWEKLIK